MEVDCNSAKFNKCLSGEVLNHVVFCHHFFGLTTDWFFFLLNDKKENLFIQF